MYYTYLIGWSQFNLWYYGSRVVNKGISPSLETRQKISNTLKAKTI